MNKKYKALCLKVRKELHAVVKRQGLAKRKEKDLLALLDAYMDGVEKNEGEEAMRISMEDRLMGIIVDMSGVEF